MARPFHDSAEHLAAELALLDGLLRAEVRRFRAAGDDRRDPLRAAYVGEAEVDRLLAAPRDAAGRTAPGREASRARLDARVRASEAAGVSLPLAALARRFALSPIELQLVVVALAPELDLKYERVFAYLQDDVARRRPTLDLALRLLCRSTAARVSALRAVAPAGTLARSGVIAGLEHGGAPLPAAELILDDALRDHLFGIEPAPAPGRSVAPAPAAPPLAALRWAEGTKRSLAALVAACARPGSAEPLLVQLRGPEGTGRRTLAAATCAEAGVALVVGDAAAACRDPASSERNLRRMLRQARLRGAALHLCDADLVTGDDDASRAASAALARAVADLSWITFLGLERPWRGSPAGHVATDVELPALRPDERPRLWSELLAGTPTAPGVDVEDLGDRFRLSPGAIAGALRDARAAARLRGEGEPVAHDDLVHACRRGSQPRLATLARPMPRRHRWDDLVLPASTLEQLHEICAQVRQRRRVLDGWGFEAGLPFGRGVCALFHGPSGVGKTIAADAVARALALEAWRIDLAAVVSKYVGETEKNLARIFDDAERANAILFFDEADALFGKRSEVKDAHDRYANVETSYLLQRVEDYDGLVLLASNLRKNIDDAFLRRMRFSVEFPFPDAAQRFRLWQLHLPERAPVGADVDVAWLAERFALSGGHIRNVALGAAFLAAEAGRAIGMSELLRATRRELHKMGRPTSEAELSPPQRAAAASGGRP